MRLKKPHVASLDEVRIRREGEDAVIEYRDSTVATVSLKIGPAVQEMTDQEILDVHNSTIRAQQQMADSYKHVPVEIPPGLPQIRYFKEGDQWVPRGDVLRCVLSDGGPDGEATVYIDDHELSLDEFGKLLCTYAGWGMRITFVPEDEICKRPLIVIGNPAEDSEEDRSNS